MSIRPRTRTRAANAVARLAVAATIAVLAACSSAATVAPPTTGAVATQETVATPSPAASATAAATSAAPTAAATDAGASSAASGAALTAPPGTPMLADPFTSAGIATTVDTTAHAVDPSTYRTTIPGTQYQAVYVVFALKPDSVGKVSMVMSLGDTSVLENPLEIDYGTINSWGDFKVTFPADGIPAGVYKAVMTFEPTGAQVVQYFAVN